MASPVRDFYQNKDVFITGATGFMGKVLVEKLCRSCSLVGNIYVLMRGKSGADAHSRLRRLLDTEIFLNLKQNNPLALKRVILVEGDLTLPQLGLSSGDQQTLCDRVSIVFHSAAIVKFDEPLSKSSLDMNVLGTRRLLQLCKNMKQLQALIHVSTAYVNCNLQVDVEEKLYPPPANPKDIIEAVEWMDDDLLQSITPGLLSERPNMYTFTKALAEALVSEESESLPVAIVRPSIVTAAWREPIPGWIDNINGPTGLLVASGKGYLRSMLAHPDKLADFVPVDVVINLMIVAAWFIATTKPKERMIYHCASGTLKPLTWGQIQTAAYPFLLRYPMPNAVRYPGGSFKRSRILNSLCMFLDHKLPAFVYDLYLMLLGRKPKMLRLFNKLYKVMQSLEYFTTHDWKFLCHNAVALNDQLTDVDKEIFCFDVKRLNWSEYFENYVKGTRRFLLKDDKTTETEARRSLKKLYFFQKCAQFFVVLVIWRCLTARSTVANYLWQLLTGLLFPAYSLFSTSSQHLPTAPLVPVD